MENTTGLFDMMLQSFGDFGFFSEITYLNELIHVQDEAFVHPSSLELTFQLTCS